MSNEETSDEKARENVAELLKTIAATAGVMLALLWGLTQRNVPGSVLMLVRISSIVLVVSIAASLLGLQFIVAELERGTAKVSKVATVATSFLAAWIAFLGGCVLLILAIFAVS